jgi:hypothetical protein
MALVMVAPEYVSRLQEWIKNEVAQHAPEGEKGLNAYSGYTHSVLARYGEKGFPSAMLGRWYDGQVKSNLRSETLRRLGLLAGLTTDPNRAETLAHLWLNGEIEPGVSLQPIDQSQLVVHSGATPKQSPGGGSIVAPDRILAYVKDAPLDSLDFLVELATACLDRLRQFAQVTEKSKETKTVIKSLIYVISGWLATNDKTIADLADELGVSEARATAIAEGSPLDAEECVALAQVLGLNVDTLVTWGACPALAQ